MSNRWFAFAFLIAALAALAPELAHAADFDAQAETAKYLATIMGEARAKSDAYFEGGYYLILVDALYGIAVASLLLFSRAAAGMRNLAERLARWRWVQVFIFAVIYTAVTSLLTLPLALYEGFYREHEYGMSNQTLDAWFHDYGIGLGIGLIASGILYATIYALIRRAPQTWWLWGTAFVSVFFMFSIAIAPVVIEPLLNDYKPMAEGPLKDSILSMARANGVPADQVFVVDASRQTKRISANVAGFMGTTRVALNDNLLNQGTPEEVKAVMGHEIGHYALGHINEMIVYFAVMTAIAFLLARWGFGFLHRAFGAWWGVRDIADPAGLPIFGIILAVLGVLATPVFNSIIRSNEAEADIFGLNAAREPDAFSRIALKLSTYRKLEPTPWEEFVFFDHPSGRSRILMSMRWKAEHLAELLPAPPPGAPEGAPADAPSATPPAAENPPAETKPAEAPSPTNP